MAIPDWTWGDASPPDSPTRRSSSPSRSPAVDPLAETLSTDAHLRGD